MTRKLKSLSPAALHAFIHHPHFSLQSLNEDMLNRPFGQQFCKDFFRSPQSYKVNGISLVDYLTGLSQADLLSLFNRIASASGSVTLEALCGEALKKTTEAKRFEACLRDWDRVSPSEKTYFFSEIFGGNGIVKSFFTGSSSEIDLAYDIARGVIAEQWLATCCPEGLVPNLAMHNMMRFHSQVTMGLGTLVMDLFFVDVKNRLQGNALSFGSIDPMHSRSVDVFYRDAAWHYVISDQLGVLGESQFAIAHTQCDLVVTPNGFALSAMQYDHERLVAALDYPSVETQCGLLLALVLDCPPGPAKGPLSQIILEQSFKDAPSISFDTQAQWHAIALDVVKLSIPNMPSIQEVTRLVTSALDFAAQYASTLEAMRSITIAYLEKLSLVASFQPVEANEACAVLSKLLQLYVSEILFSRIVDQLANIGEKQQGIRFHPALQAMHVAFQNQPSQIDFYLTFLAQLKQYTLSALRVKAVKTFLNEVNPLSVEEGIKSLINGILRAELHEDVSEALCRTCVVYAKENQPGHDHKEALYFHRGLKHECNIFTAKDKASGVVLFSVKTTDVTFSEILKGVLPKSPSLSRSFFSRAPSPGDIAEISDKTTHFNQACYLVCKAQMKSLLPYVSLLDAARMFLELGAMQQMIHFVDPVFHILKGVNTLDDLGRLYNVIASTLSSSDSEREKIVQLDATGLSEVDKMTVLLKRALLDSKDAVVNALRDLRPQNELRMAM